MSLKIYVYDKCSTCRKALKFLDAQGTPYQALPIREQPPTKSELRRMLKAYEGEIRKLFNTSGLDYRSQNLKERLPTLSGDEAIELLSSNGNLVKRPFAISKNVALVGFNETAWQAQLEH